MLTISFPQGLLRSCFRLLEPLHVWTSRGWIVALLSAGSLYYVAIPEFDLTAYLLGTVGLAVLLLTSINALVTRSRLRPRLRATALHDAGSAFSQQPIAASLLLEQSSLPPLFSMLVSRTFSQPGAQSPHHLVRGSADPNRRTLSDQLIFPHRGVWLLSHLQVELRDSFGLTCFRWRLPIGQELEISAPLTPIQPLPVIAGSSRIGDILDIARDRSGDPFDIKPYDPGDGVNRILWKTFARTGELVVRRQEPAVVPEGEVAVYLVAGKEEDYVVGATKSYLRQLREHQITVLFGTDGMITTNSSQNGTDVGFVQDDLGVIETAINRAVWTKEVGSAKAFASFLEALHRGNKFVERVMVFAPEHNRSGWLNRILDTSRSFQIQPTLALVSAVHSGSRPELSQLSEALLRSGAPTFICKSSEHVYA